MSTESYGVGTRIRYWRLRFRAWRWHRPFWAGLLTIIGGLPIAYFPYANMTFGQLTVRMATTAGSGSLIIGVLLLVLGLTMWYQPLVRIFAGVAAILLALVSIVVSNFGGFVMGFLLALIGGALALAWAPGQPTAETGDQTGDQTGEQSESAAQAAAGEGDESWQEPVAAGAGTDDETINENGRHRAG